MWTAIVKTRPGEKQKYLQLRPVGAERLQPAARDAEVGRGDRRAGCLPRVLAQHDLQQVKSRST